MGDKATLTLNGLTLPRLPHLSGDLSASEGADGPSLPQVPGYTLMGELGRGSMGVVYLARHQGLNRQVALKMILIGAHADPSLITRFYAETQTVAKLHHPGIVQVFDSGWCDGLPYCALEFLPGGTLADRLDGKPWAAKKAAELVLTLARAIQAAHEAGVIHRDLKPANILFDGDGRAKITDFGVAKDLLNPEGGYTQSGDIIGTPSYMAPEQAGGSSKRVGPEADTYALGVLLYELLTGDVPFVGLDPLDVMIQVRTLEPIPPRRRVHSVPADLDVICMKCLEKDTHRRYVSAKALADDLQAFLDDRPIQARAVSDWEKFRRWGRRNPLIASLFTAITGLFLMAFVLVSVNFWQAQQALHTEANLRHESQGREKAERWARYRASISAAGTALQLFNLNLARQALDNAPTEHRNWEWHHFSRQMEGAQRIHPWPQGIRLFFSYHGDSDLIRLLFPQETWLWDARSDREVKRVAHEPATEVCFAPDGQTYVVTSPGRPLTIHDLATDEILTRVENGSMVRPIAIFSPDSRRLFVQMNYNGVRLLDARTGQTLYEHSSNDTEYVHHGFSRDGRRCAFSEYRQGRCFYLDSENGTLLQSWLSVTRKHSGGNLNHAGDRLLLVPIYPELDLELWDPTTATLLTRLTGHENQVFHIAFSADDRQLATGSMDHSVRLWDARTGAPRLHLQGHRGWVNSLVFSPDGSRLISASHDHTLRLWDTAKGQTLSILQGHTREVDYANFSRDGKRIYSWGTDRAVRVWDVRAVERKGVLRGHSDFVYGVAIHPQGKQWASASWDGTVRLWDAVSNDEVGRFHHTPKTSVVSVAYSPRGTHLASAGRDGSVRLWNLDTRQEEHRWEFAPSNWRDCRLAFSPNGKYLALGDTHGHIQMWDLDTRRHFATFPSQQVYVADLAFSPDGSKLIAVGDEGAVLLLDVATQTLERRLPRHEASFYSLAFSASGRLLATAAVDGSVLLWDTATWNQIDRLDPGTRIYSVAFSPDETRLAIGCANTTIQLWDVQRRQQVAELNGHSRYVHQVVFTHDGKKLLSASGDTTLRVWDTR